MQLYRHIPAAPSHAAAPVAGKIVISPYDPIYLAENKHTPSKCEPILEPGEPIITPCEPIFSTTKPTLPPRRTPHPDSATRPSSARHFPRPNSHASPAESPPLSPPPHTVSGDTGLLTSTPPLIELLNVTVMRGDSIALRNLSLTIGAGEHVAILGPNGCGKSTLIKTITRECYPLAQPGTSVTILGQRVWDVVSLRSTMGIVTNDLMAQCTREIKGFEIVLSGFFSSIGIWPNHHVTEKQRRKAADVLRFLESAHLGEKRVDEMSSGEARRMLIGRALVNDPKALLLDEPSTSLDLFAQHELRESIRKLAKAGVGIVLVTHHLSDIIPEIERVIMMSGGEIAADGAKEDVLTAAGLAELFGVKAELAKRGGYYHLW